jgi:hypothetical protein
VNRAPIKYREPVMDMQLIQERIAGAAMEMFASACVISRLDSDLQGIAQNGGSAPANRKAAHMFLRQSFHPIRRFVAELTDNDDTELLAPANSVLGNDNRAADETGNEPGCPNRLLVREALLARQCCAGPQTR